MAVGAHEVPILLRAGPVQGIAGRYFLIRIKMEPSLTTLRARATVPGDTERLQTAAREPDQILLQRRDAESVIDSIVMQGAVGSVCVHEKSGAAAKKPRADAVVRQARAIEVAQYGRIGGRLHRKLMMRA